VKAWEGGEKGGLEVKIDGVVSRGC
jgi:hypothetical protein